MALLTSLVVAGVGCVGCGGFRNDFRGILNVASQPHTDCAWLISSPVGSQITVRRRVIVSYLSIYYRHCTHGVERKKLNEKNHQKKAIKHRQKLGKKRRKIDIKTTLTVDTHDTEEELKRKEYSDSHQANALMVHVTEQK